MPPIAPHLRSLLLIPACLLAVASCTHRGTWQELQPRKAEAVDGSEVRRAIVKNETETLSGVHSPVDDAARYLAGLPGGRNSPLATFRERPEWALHTNNLNELWRRFEVLRRAAIESWASRELRGLRSPDTLFYPFSGPDFLFADTFFPGADTVILCGLESADPLPELTSLDDAQRKRALEGLYTSLTSALNFSFFITKDMRVDLQATEIRGTLPVLLVCMARTGHHVDSVEPVALDASGNVVARPADGGSSPGFRIKSGSKTIYYFNTNLANGPFSPQSRFARFVRAQGPCVSFTKSASFLMHEGDFSHIRNFVLEQSTAVLQDDSGVPLKNFDAEKWNVTHYGRYSGVLDIFKKYHQPDLAAAHEQATEPLGFGIGYKHQQGQSVMILARRR